MPRDSASYLDDMNYVSIIPVEVLLSIKSASISKVEKSIVDIEG